MASIQNCLQAQEQGMTSTLCPGEHVRSGPLGEDIPTYSRLAVEQDVGDQNRTPMNKRRTRREKEEEQEEEEGKGGYD